nr:hypothetical protein [Terriglobus sp. TAA 43]
MSARLAEVAGGEAGICIGPLDVGGLWRGLKLIGQRWSPEFINALLPV